MQTHTLTSPVDLSAIAIGHRCCAGARKAPIATPTRAGPSVHLRRPRPACLHACRNRRRPAMFRNTARRRAVTSRPGAEAQTVTPPFARTERSLRWGRWLVVLVQKRANRRREMAWPLPAPPGCKGSRRDETGWGSGKRWRCTRRCYERGRRQRGRVDHGGIWKTAGCPIPSPPRSLAVSGSQLLPVGWQYGTVG